MRTFLQPHTLVQLINLEKTPIVNVGCKDMFVCNDPKVHYCYGLMGQLLEVERGKDFEDLFVMELAVW